MNLTAELQSSINFVRTVVPPPDPAERRMPYWMTRITEFERLEVRPHARLADLKYSYLEPCKDRDAEDWMVIGIYDDASIEPCEHFPTKCQALIFRDGLVAACPHLAKQHRRRHNGNLAG